MNPTHPTPIDSPPPPFDKMSFVRYMKDIGREYRQQARKLLSICRIFAEAQKQTPNSYDEFRSVLQVVDDALYSVTKARKKTTKDADAKLAKATDALSAYEMKYHLRETVTQTMAEAEAQDNKSSKILNRLKETFREERMTEVKFHHQKPLDKNPTIVKQMLSQTSDTKEKLPTSAEKYEGQLRTNPVETFKEALDVQSRHFPDPVDSSRAKVSPSLAGVTPATCNDQLDIAAGPNINHTPIAAEPVANWKEVVHPTWNSRDTNVYISTKQTPGLKKNRVLPPADNLLHKTIDALNNDVLLSIFRSYRLNDDENWNLQRRWYKLIHVCRKWRHLIYESPSHLDLCLLITNGTPVADMLNHSPPLPLTINYQNTACANRTTEDEEGILLALQHHDRVRRIVLHAPPQGLQKFLTTALNENFPTLERLSILSTFGDDDARLVMPRAFQAAHLSHLTLLGCTLSAEPRSLASTVSLVSLTLTNLGPYFPPEDLAAQLQFVPLLEELSIGFSVPIPCSRIRIRGIESPIRRATLPALKRFIFRGVSAYLEGLLERINAPCIRKFDVTLFNQLIFALPVLSRFIDATTELRLPVAKINFNLNSLSISISDNREEGAQGERSLYVQVSCRPLDWQVSSAVQICNALWGMLPTVEELAIDFYQHGMPPEWRNEVDGNLWCDLLSRFKRVKKLRVGHALTLDLSCAQQPDEKQLGTGVSGGMPAGLLSSLLPVLQELVLKDDFTSYHG